MMQTLPSHYFIAAQSNFADQEFPGRAAARAIRSVQTTYYSICAWCSADPGSILTSGAIPEEWLPVLQRSVLVSLTCGRDSLITLRCARDTRVWVADKGCGGLAQ